MQVFIHVIEYSCKSLILTIAYYSIASVYMYLI